MAPSAIYLLALLACATWARAADTGGTVTNLSGTALDCVPVPISLPGGPPDDLSADGVLASQPDPDDPSRVWLLCCLPARASAAASTGAAAPPAPVATWNPEAGCGELSNAVLRVTAAGGETALSLADGRPLLQSLSFYGWLTDAPVDLGGPRQAQEQGVAHVNTRGLPVAQGRVLCTGPVFSALELRREASGKAAGLVVTERLTAFAGKGDAEYRLTLENAKDRDLYVANCDGVIYARWPAETLPLRLYTPRGVDGIALSPEWLAVPADAPSPERGLWAAAATETGPSLGLGALSGRFQTWAFTKDSFWLYVAGPEGKRPIRLAPGGKLTWRLLLCGSPAGGDGAADGIQARCQRAARPPVRVALDGRVLAEGAPASLGPGNTMPVLLTPFDGQPLTDLATFCTWESVRGAGRYELQLSRTPDFSDARSFRAPALDADRSAWMPQVLPESGLWCWRVRAFAVDGEPGEWSGTRSFTLSPPAPGRPPAFAPTSDHPLFILHSPDEIAQAWSAIPEDLRPHCALRLEVASRDLDMRGLCAAADAEGVNLIVQCSGPGGGPYSEVYGGHYGRQSLSELEWAFDNCPRVVGALVCEQNFHIRSDPTSAEYVRRLADLVTSHGKLLVFADGHWGSFAWLEMGKDPALLDIFREHRQNVVPLWKMNCGQVPLSIHGAVLGYWAAGLVDQFGVEPEDWYWFEAGFGGLGEASGRLNGGDHEKLPPTMWGQMLLLGLASGASCFCLEPYTGIWRYGHPDQTTEAWSRVVKPLLRAVVAHRLVPDRETALADVRIAVQTAPALPAFGDDYGELKPLYETLYGIRHFAELIPDTGRYGIVPLLPPLAESAGLPAGMRRVSVSKLPDAAAVHAAFDPLYPPTARGDAFVRVAGDSLVVMNSRENEDITQHFELSPGVEGLATLSGALGPHAYVVGKREHGGLWLQINGRAERATTLAIHAGAVPSVVAVADPDALTQEWDARAGILRLTIRHDDGAVEVRVEPPG